MSGIRAWAQGNPQFGMIGLAAGQMLRLNVVAYPPDPCNATIGFLNANGQVPPNQPVKNVSLSPWAGEFRGPYCGVAGNPIRPAYGIPAGGDGDARAQRCFGVPGLGR